MSDTARVLNDLEVVVSNLVPEVDSTRLKISLEETLERYEVKTKTYGDMEADLLSNIRLYISTKRIEGLAETTLADYYRELVMFEFFACKSTVQVSTTDVRRYLAENDKVMASTNAKKLSVINTFFAWLVEEEIILRNPAARIKQMKQPKRLPKALSAVELEQIRESCETLRERALVEVMYSTGCRLSEIAGMKRKGVNWTRGSMNVIGKGDKERIVYLNPKAGFHLERYLEECEEGENESEYLFSTERRPYRQLKNKSIQDIIEKIASRTNIQKKVTPHVFRHTMATLAMENGIELGDLQQLLGHESANTTLRYAAVSEDRKYSAHKRFVQ